MDSINISIIFQTPATVRMSRVGWMLYSSCWPQTMFQRQMKMNSNKFLNYFFIIWGRSRCILGGTFVKILKVTTLVATVVFNQRRASYDYTPPYPIPKLYGKSTLPTNTLHLFIFLGFFFLNFKKEYSYVQSDVFTNCCISEFFLPSFLLM